VYGLFSLKFLIFFLKNNHTYFYGQEMSRLDKKCLALLVKSESHREFKKPAEESSSSAGFFVA